LALIGMGEPQVQRAFPTTHWTEVLAAGKRSTPESRRALEALCQTYWYPLYTYVRRRGYSADQAQDLVQAFLLRFLEKSYLDDVRRERGRFRCFLLASVQHFLSNEWDRERAKKRGGGVPPVPLILETAEHRYNLEPADTLTPETIFDRQWALAVLEQVHAQLRGEFDRAGKTLQFDCLSAFLTADEPPSYAESATLLNLSEGAVRVAVHRLRRRYGQLLRSTLSQTVSSPSDVDEEIRFLRSALSK
jgi:RNA polymerase sigma-70 factor (ECF subfamily)